MPVDFSNPETKALYVAEVSKRMDAPFYMSREQAEMLVAVLMTGPPSPKAAADTPVKRDVGETR
jgi:hypothetical protein